MIRKKEIVNYLKDKGLYQDVDIELINELIFNLEIIKESKDDIKKRGVLTPINNEGTLLGQNPSIGIYNNGLKNYLNICRKLSLSVYDRKTLKINIDDNEDNF